MSGIDFGAAAFLDRLAPHLVADSAVLPRRPTIGDASLDPSLAEFMAQRRLKEAAVLVPVLVETAAPVELVHREQPG